MFKSGSGDKLVHNSARTGKSSNTFFSFSSHRRESPPSDILVWYGFVCDEPPPYLLDRLGILKSPQPLDDNQSEYFIGVELYKIETWKPLKHLESGNIEIDQLLYNQQLLMNIKKPLLYHFVSPSTTPYVVIIPEYISSLGSSSTDSISRMSESVRDVEGES